MWPRKACGTRPVGSARPAVAGLRRDKRGGAGADRIGQDLHLRTALSQPENSGGLHRPDPRRDNVYRYRAELKHRIAERAEPRSSSARSRAASKLRRSPMMHHKRIVIDQIHESDGFAGHALAADTAATTPLSGTLYHKPLTMDQFCYVSFRSLRLRGGHAFPALIAARLASRIATICFACERVSSRRLARPPRLPMAARYCRTSFLLFMVTANKDAS